jgi:serine/threonine-protein kinase
MLARGVRPGAVLARKYRLLDCLGKGGMGQVWRAQDVVLGAPIAVKVIDPDLLETHQNRPEVVARFLREAQAAAALRSPHVVQILEFGVDDDGIPFMAMELLEGETLAQRLARVRILPYADTARIVTHLARAIGKAHELGIVHRDLKPGNVFLTKNDDEELAKVMDFGIAKKVVGALDDRGALVTRTGRIVGTPAYMSPEQTVGNKPIDARSDLWALGVMAYECVVGRRPFDASTHGELTLQIVVNPLPIPSEFTRVPPGFDAWFERAVAREPDKRFQSARELSEALRAVLLQPGLLPPDVPKLPPLPLADTQRGLATSRTLALPVRRGGRVLVGVMLGCLTGSIVLGILIWRDRMHRREAASVIEERATGASTPPVAATPATIATPTPIAVEQAPEPTVVAESAPSAEPSAAVQAPPVRRPVAKPRAPRSEPGKDPRLGF